jgi:hypothetical protein
LTHKDVNAGDLTAGAARGIDLRLGRWQDVLAGVECDALICDPPYGARTHESTVDVEEGTGRTAGLSPSYAGWTSANVEEFVSSWSPRCKGWMVAMTSHDLIPSWERAHLAVGRYCFAPVPCLMRGMSVRMAGDGPSSWTVYAVVSRPRSKAFSTWGTLDGAYTGSPSREAGGGRGKPAWLLSALVRDYSRPGDLVCDPFAGWGSTLAAAVANGRRAIGSEMDADAYAEAQRRLARPLQVDMFGGAA